MDHFMCFLFSQKPLQPFTTGEMMLLRVIFADDTESFIGLLPLIQAHYLIIATIWPQILSNYKVASEHRARPSGIYYVSL